jgi:DNA-binding Lrp family transcriptional regulator
VLHTRQSIDAGRRSDIHRAAGGGLAAHPELTTLHAISGEYDLIAEIEAADPEALNELIDRIGMLDGSARTTSSIILATKTQR